MSSFPDAAGAGEGKQKERTPKGYIPADILLGHKVKNLMTVIAESMDFSDGELSDSNRYQAVSTLRYWLE